MPIQAPPAPSLAFQPEQRRLFSGDVGVICSFGAAIRIGSVVVRAADKKRRWNFARRRFFFQTIQAGPGVFCGKRAQGRLGKGQELAGGCDQTYQLCVSFRVELSRCLPPFISWVVRGLVLPALFRAVRW